MSSRDHKRAFDDALARFKRADAFVTTILERIGRTDGQLRKARADVEAIEREIAELGKNGNGDFEKQMRSVSEVSARKVGAEATVKVFQQTLANLSDDLADAKVKLALAELACLDAQREHFVAYRDEQLTSFLESNRERMLELIGAAHLADFWSGQPQKMYGAAESPGSSIDLQSFIKTILISRLHDFLEPAAAGMDPRLTRKDQPPASPIRSAHIAGPQRTHLALALQFNERSELEIRKAVMFVPAEATTKPGPAECGRRIYQLNLEIEGLEVRLRQAETRNTSNPGDQEALAELEDARLDYERAVASRNRWQEMAQARAA